MHFSRFTIFLGLSALCGGLLIIQFLLGNVSQSGPVLSVFFLFLALAFRESEALRGYAYTVLIFSAGALAMYYPMYFQSLGPWKLTTWITPLIQVIMFGMGTSMRVEDFRAVWRQPKGVAIGLSAQFLIMPFLGYSLAVWTDFPPEISAGIVLMGCTPSGLASNVMCYIAKANLALSLTITSLATLLAPLLTPLLMKLLAGQFIALDPVAMMWDIAKMILLPIGAGLLFKLLLAGRVGWLERILPYISMGSVAVIILIITAAGRDYLLRMGMALIGVVMVHNFLGYALGYGFAKIFRMSDPDARTVALEVGMQNAGLASGIANGLGKIATMGLAPAVFGPVMNISGSLLASFWGNRK